MHTRLDYFKISPEPVKIMYRFEKYMKAINLDDTLLELDYDRLDILIVSEGKYIC